MPLRFQAPVRDVPLAAGDEGKQGGGVFLPDTVADTMETNRPFFFSFSLLSSRDTIQYDFDPECVGARMRRRPSEGGVREFQDAGRGTERVRGYLARTESTN